MPEQTNPIEASAALNPTETSSNPSGPVITTERTSTEVLDSNGKSLSRTTSSLGDIFDKIADGTPASAAVKEVMQKDTVPANEPAAEVQPKEETGIVIEKRAEKGTAPVAKEEAPAKTEKSEEDIPETELQVLPHDKPRTAKRIEKLLKKITETEERYVTTEKGIKERDEKLANLQRELEQIRTSDPFSNEEVKKQIEELQMYRRRYSLENDPEVKKRFDDRVVSAETGIANLLSANRAPETLINIIKEEGGWLRFADSNRTVKLANGKEVTAAELAEMVRGQLSLSERRRLEAMELEQTQAARDKQVYFDEEAKKAQEYFATRETQSKQQAEAQKKAFEEATKFVVDWKQKLVSETEWLHPKDVPATATPEQKAAIEDHNTHAKQLLSQIDKYLGAKDLNGMLEVVTDALRYHQERRERAFALSKIEKLENELKTEREKLDRFKRASSAVPKGGSLSSAPTPTREGAERKGPASLEQAFDMMASGKSIDTQ